MASQCQTSTSAPTSGPQIPAEVRETRKRSRQGDAGRAARSRIAAEVGAVELLVHEERPLGLLGPDDARRPRTKGRRWATPSGPGARARAAQHPGRGEGPEQLDDLAALGVEYRPGRTLRHADSWYRPRAADATEVPVPPEIAGSRSVDARRLLRGRAQTPRAPSADRRCALVDRASSWCERAK